VGLSGSWVFEVGILKVERVGGINLGNGFCHGFIAKLGTQKGSSL